MGHSVDWAARTHRQEDRLPLRGAVCIVEPDPRARRRMMQAASRMGFVTHETGAGAAAAFIAREVRLEAMVLNLGVKDANALMLIRQLRRAYPGLRIVTVAPGGPSQPPLFHELARFAGADVALAAPVSSAALSRALAARRERWTPDRPVPQVTAPGPGPA